MANFCNNVEDEILTWLFGGVDTRAASGSVFVALHTSDPGEEPDGSTELDSGTLSYERVETSAGSDWSITDNEATTTTAVSFPQAAEDWGTVTHFSLWDGADATANPLFTDVIRDSGGNQTEKDVSMDDSISFEAGGITATID